jgi:hypothetical protein
VPGAAHITKPDTEKDAELPVHRGAAAVIDGTERTFLDKYGDYFWFALLLLSGIGSAGAWLRHYFNRDEREENTSHRKRILAMVSRVRSAESNQELLAMQREVDAIIGDTNATMTAPSRKRNWRPLAWCSNCSITPSTRGARHCRRAPSNRLASRR